MRKNANYHDFASMAEASYVLLDLFDYEDVDKLRRALIGANKDDYNGRFSETQADEFLAHWQVLDHQPNTPSGFSGTLFQRIDDDPVNGYKAGDLVFALRGTETGPFTILDDLYQADFRGIVANGLAFRQIVDMYNYWQRLITPEDDWAQQARLVLAPSGTPGDKIINESGFKWMLEFESTALGLGRVDLDDNLIAATGHSLGGHLATAFSRLFPAWTMNAVTINGAGYPTGDTQGLTGTALQNIDNLFSSLGGASAFDASKILNLYGEKGLEVTTMNASWGLMQQGLHVPVYIEDALGNALGHGASQMTDALAVYGLFIDLVPALKNGSTTDTFGELLRLSEVASSQASRSYESLVDEVAELFKVGATITEKDDREALYRKISDIRDPTTAYSGMVDDANNAAMLRNLSDYIDPAVIAQKATQELAFRYALKTLSPFALLNIDAVYTQHNQNHELDLYSPATKQGMTGAYLEDRAAFALALMEWNRLDGSPDIQTASSPWHFEDLVLDIRIDNSLRASELPTEVDEAKRYLFGTDKPDHLVGGGENDALYGGADNDRLTGLGGADYLEGGNGHDTYFAGDGDEIFDHDGDGRVVFDEVLLGAGIGSNGVYASADGAFQYTLTDGDLIVSRQGDGAALKIANFVNGHLGITLEQPDPPPSGRPASNGSNASEVIYGQTDPAVTNFEQVNGYNLPDQIHGQDGRDWIYAWDNGPQDIENGVVINSAPDTDIVEGGSGKDFIHGGAGADQLYATEILDAAAVKAGQGSTAYGGIANDEGDFISGQSGDDELYGSGRVDGLFGGDGDDLIYGGGGDDVIAGDWSVVISTLSMNPTSHDYEWYSVDGNGEHQLQLFAYRGGTGKDRIYAGDGNDLVWGGAADDTLYGNEGDDQLNGDITGTDVDGNPKLPAELHGNDFLAGGAGDDALNGNGGADVLLGGSGDDVIDGDFRVIVGNDLMYLGDDYLDGGDGNDMLSGNGGDDVLLGGNDNDALFGDLDGLDASKHGADVLYGGAGVDQLLGQGGDDILHGGSGNDILFGDDNDLYVLSGNDTLFGGAGADELSGGLGDDLLNGGEGRDSIWGDPGDDRLSGGAGLDYLAGGSGADTYAFSAGDSQPVDGELETIDDAAGQGNRIVFASDVGRDSLQLTPLGDSGDLILRYAESDAVYVFGGLTGSIASYAFSDGAPVTYQALLSELIPSANYLAGGSGNDLVFGSAQGEALSGGAGDDQLLAGDGDDTLEDDSGTNRLVGGAGTDTYILPVISETAASRSSQNAIIDSPDRSSIVRFGSGIEPTDLNLQFFGSTVLLSAGMQVLVLADGASGDLVNRFEFASGDVLDFRQLKTLHALAPNLLDGGAGDDVLQGTNSNDNISGGAGDDDLAGGAGRDRLDGGPGADLLAGGTGFDTYLVDHPDDVVIEKQAAGYDFVFSSVDYILPEHVEGLELSGSGPVSGTGNAMGNYIAGNSGANLLFGGGGDDRIHGGGGMDIIDGGPGDDQLEGRFQLFGGDGNDHLLTRTDSSDGAVPIYELAGGDGDDLYEISQPQHMRDLGSIVESAGEGMDTLVLHADVMLLTAGLPEHVENLRYEYSGELWFGDGVVLVGNQLNNRIEIGTPNPGSTPRLEGLAGDDVLVGSNLDDSGSERAGLYGGDGDDQLHGRDGIDHLDGGPGDDLLEGGRGADRLFGGIGSDTYLFSLGDSPAVAGMSMIDDPDGGSVIRFGKGIQLQDISLETTGSDLQIRYSANDSFLLKGGAAGDPVAGYAFANGSFYSQKAFDHHLQGNLAPVLGGLVPNIDAFEGRPLTFDLPSGLFTDPDGDVLQYELAVVGGGSLPTWIDFDGAGRRLQIDAKEGDAGIYQLRLSASDPAGEMASTGLTVDIEDVIFHQGSEAADLLKGTTAADELQGESGDDRLYGHSGNDWLVAGAGADVLYGGRGDDRLHGGAGNDVLNGQAGADEMLGGAGDDRYYLDSIADRVIEVADEGVDRVYSYIEHQLQSHFEDLVLLGDGDLQGIGNTADNRLYGNVGANSLSGGAGDDLLYGRDGDDQLLGGSGNDILNGQSGDDEMIGGPGNDRYHVDSSADSVLELADDGTDRVYSSVDQQLAEHVEELVLQGHANLDGIGNAGDNRLYGNPGDNELHGAAGDDRLYGREGNDRLLGGVGNDVMNGQSGGDEMLGGPGNDRYYVDASADYVLEYADEGQDRIYSSVDYVLGQHLEDLTLLGEMDLEGFGNEAGNLLYGNPGINQLRGEAGNDRLYGRDGSDQLFGGAGDDILKGEAGDDALHGGDGADRLYGGVGDDLIVAGPGDDLLDGGAGDDAYHFGVGDGADRIRNGASEDLAAGTDSLIFEQTIAPDQIWFSRAGNDLLAQLMGGIDQIRLSGWYLDAPAPVDQVQAGEDMLIAADQVDQLVNAVAGFGVQRAPVIELTPEQHTQYSTMIAAYWGTSAQMSA